MSLCIYLTSLSPLNADRDIFLENKPNAMTRRKKPPPQRKRQQVTDSSGWTHVIKGPPGITDPSTTNKRLDHGKRTETKYILETYLDRFRTHYTPIWRESDCFKNLSRIFEQNILPTSNIPITQCICLGLGSLTAGSENSSYELAALISMLEILGTVLIPQDKQTAYVLHPLSCPAKPDTTNRKNPPHPTNHPPRPHFQPPRRRHSPKTRLHRRRHPRRVFQTQQRHNIPLRTPSRMLPLRHRFGGCNARAIHRL